MVEIWTDGSSINYNGKWFGGCGVLLRYKNKEKEISEPFRDFTNNMAELNSIIIGLQSLKFKCKVKVLTDSNYSLQCVNSWIPKWYSNGWKTSKGEDVKNKDLIVKLYNLCQYHEVDFIKVKAHSGIEDNERVDKLAYKAAKICLEEYKQNDG